ncbi:hypothetical protein [Synechococcus sp. M16CYN]|uniref:hypothetical protein n=1 Tax=Synechococcus sp. M16CYN TaxID=3103139 RepID=UPI00334161AE
MRWQQGDRCLHNIESGCPGCRWNAAALRIVIIINPPKLQTVTIPILIDFAVTILTRRKPDGTQFIRCALHPNVTIRYRLNLCTAL